MTYMLKMMYVKKLNTIIFVADLMKFIWDSSFESLFSRLIVGSNLINLIMTLLLHLLYHKIYTFKPKYDNFFNSISIK